MAKQKSRFPSYGLVRGPSHEQGGVAGMVAGEQPVELEGGEWIIPKEAVPDYLPVLKQITNEGRAMQQMQNGNSAMDALIASASMETGLAQPKSPMFMGGGMMDEYEGGGQLHSRRMYNQKDKKKYGYEMGGMMPEYQDGGQVQSKTLRGARRISSDLQPIDGRFQAQSIFAIPADQVGGEEGLRYYLSDPRMSSDMSMAMSKAALDARSKMAFSPEDSLPAALVEGYFDQLESPSPLENVKKKGFGFLNKLLGKNKEQGGMIKQYQQGGQMQPRKQQEIRNPQMYGPPDSLMGPDTTMGNLDDLLNYYMESDRRNKLNALTGDTIDPQLDSLRLLQRMKKSKMPRTGRKSMQDGGEVKYNVAGLEGLENRFPDFDAPMSNPEFEAAMQYGERGTDAPTSTGTIEEAIAQGLVKPQSLDSLMGNISEDKRIRPADNYEFAKNPKVKLTVPKLSSAYMQSMGIETPLSRRQRSLLQRKAIAPETRNPQVRSLLGRALVQRLANEPI